MIEKFTAYRKTTGAILFSGMSSKPELLETHEVGIIVGDAFDGSIHFIDNGKAIKLPDCPSKFHVFNYTTKRWEFNANLAQSGVRAQRDRLLASTDWTQLPDVPLPTKEAWAAYRQALRDITRQPDLSNISWPVPPG